MFNLARNLFDYERPETPGDVVFFKLFEVFIVYGTLELAWSWGAYIQRITDIVLPLGIAQYIDVSFLFSNGLSLVNAGIITALVALGFFRVWRWAYLVAFLLLHLQYAARFTLGEIPHSSNLVGMTLLGLALAVPMFSQPHVRRRFTLGFAYFFIGLGYSLAAWSKLIGTGPTWSRGEHLWMWIYEKSTDTFAKTGVLDLNFLQEWALAVPLIATAFLTFGLLSEFFAFLMWWKPLRYPVMFAVLGLHIGIWIVMGILFKLSVIEVTMLMLPWAVYIDWLRARSTGADAVFRPIEALGNRFA